MNRYIRIVASLHKTLVLILLPLILLPLIISVGTQEAKCAYVVIITAIFWMFEVLPLAVTSLLPAALFPIVGVSSIEEVSTKYLRQINMLFIGSLVVAIAVEESMLHKRIALNVLRMVGTDIKWIMLGCMFVTWFLSMWITNTSATAMMLPIVQAILSEIEHVEIENKEDKNGDIALQVTDETGVQESSCDDNHRNPEITVNTNIDTREETVENGNRKEIKAKVSSMRKGMLLCIAYSANIGGSATVTGTPPNLELLGQLNSYYGSGTSGVNFASWLIFSGPNAFIILIISWIWLTLYFIGWRHVLCLKTKPDATATTRKDNIKKVLARQYEELGAMTFCEAVVLCLFILLAILWITRNPAFIPGAKGWGSLFNKGFVTDSTAALVIAISFFILPREMPDWKSEEPTPKILEWTNVQHKLPWNVVLLMGAGFAIAYNVQASGLSKWIGGELQVLEEIAPSLILFIICCTVAMVTELASNTAVAVIVIPILKEMSKTLVVHPLYLMLPSVISASFAFMLPVATPPNAIVFSSGDLAISDMMRCGVVMNILCISILQLSINTYGIPQFNLNEYPAWANSSVITTTTAP